MANHFHPCIPVMPGQLPSTYEYKEAAIFFSNLLSYGCTAFFHVLGINAPVGNDERASQLDNMRIAICVSHKRKFSFSRVNASKNIITLILGKPSLPMIKVSQDFDQTRGIRTPCRRVLSCETLQVHRTSKK